jgi:hypothetical protein
MTHSNYDRTSLTVKLYSGCPNFGALSLISKTSTTSWYSLEKIQNKIVYRSGKDIIDLLSVLEKKLFRKSFYGNKIPTTHPEFCCGVPLSVATIFSE